MLTSFSYHILLLVFIIIFVNPFNIVHWVHDTWSHCKKLFLISKAVGTMGHNSATPTHHSKEVGRACGCRTDIMAKGHQHAHGWKTLLGKRKDSAKGKLNHVLLYSFIGKSTSCCKQTLTSGAVKHSNFTFPLPSQQPDANGCVTHLAPALYWRKAAW